MTYSLLLFLFKTLRIIYVNVSSKFINFLFQLLKWTEEIFVSFYMVFDIVSSHSYGTVLSVSLLKLFIGIRINYTPLKLYNFYKMKIYNLFSEWIWKHYFEIGFDYKLISFATMQSGSGDGIHVICIFNRCPAKMKK